MTTASTPVLEGRELVRTYGTVQALQGADFAVEAGTVTALIGDNGAGKSTLVKVLSGVEQPDGGVILLDGEPVVFRSPMDAHRRGIETVFRTSPSLPTSMPRPTRSSAANFGGSACSTPGGKCAG